MSSIRIIMSRPAAGTVQEVVDQFTEEIKSVKLPPSLVFSRVDQVSDAVVALAVLEKLFPKGGGHATMTLQLTDDGSLQRAIAICSGEGEGLFNTSWQVNTEFLTRVEEILTGMGFQPEA